MHDPDKILRDMRMFLDRPFLQNDFIFSSVISTILREISSKISLEEVARRINAPASELPKWAKGKSLPHHPNTRARIYKRLAEEIDKHLQTEQNPPL